MKKLLSVLSSTLQGGVRGGLLLLLLVASVSAIYASDIKVGGIWYDFDSSTKTASVTYRGSYYHSYDDEYSGSVVIPKTVTYNGTTYSVTRIGSSAFEACSSLTSITIPESVTSIGKEAFEDCSSLTSITIPNSVTSIGNGAFRHCSSLPVEDNLRYADTYLVVAVDKKSSTYSIKEGTKWIGNDAFYGCDALTSITIPNSVTSIGEEAFHFCSSLTSITIPNSVTSIGDNAFYSCSSLTSVTIPNSVTSIGNGAFTYCSSLTSVNIPNSVTSIGGWAFSDCSSLTSITIPNSVTSIGNYAFQYCRSLISVTIPNSVTSIGGSAFEHCSSLTSVTINSNAIVSKAYSYDSNISHIFGSKVTEYIIGESVTSIGSSAFYNCSSLTSVTIPNSVTSIGFSAFYNCSSLTKTNYTGDIAGWCNIEFGDIYANPMYYSHKFYINDQEIKDLVIPNSVTSIGSYAFNGCPSLTSVTIPNNVTSIGSCAFYGCYSLTKTNYTGDIAGWCNIEFGDIYANPMYYSHKFYINDQEIKDLVIPNSVTSIGSYAFNGCSSLTSVTIPNSVTSIGEEAFAGCYFLTSVTIPNSVTSIGSSAFKNCSSLTSITCEVATPPTVGSETFYGVSTSIPVYVPCGSVQTYKAASGWSDFTNLQEPLAEYSIEVDVNDSIMGTAQVDVNNVCGAQISSKPNFGYHFVQWSDGNTNNPRSLELTQDTILTAEFALTQSGQCGDNLYWELIDDTLHITGTGAMYDYTYGAPWKRSIKALCIGESVTSIGERAFEDCSSLTSVTIPNSVTSIGSSAFEDCSSLTSVTIGESVTSIGDDAFYKCSSLTYITIPESVTSIGNWAFRNCSSLTSVTIPNSVTSIGEEAFAGCYFLTSVTIPNSVTSIGEAAFRDCSSLTSLTIGNGVTSIGNYAFYGCSKLTSVTIPNSVTSIGNNAFYNCSSLTSVTINSDAIVSKDYSYGGHISSIFGSQVTEYIIGDDVKGIGNECFSGCYNLTSITIGESVRSIGESAFYKCSKLASMTCEAITPPSFINTSYTFYGVSTPIPLYVPCGCVEAYKASAWEYFTNIQEPLMEYSVEVDANDTIMGTTKVDHNTFCQGTQISATPNIGYHFVQWSDGNTDAIRTLELTQDTILTAEFAQSFFGKCGNNLYWELIETTLHITGSGEMYNYTSDTAPWKLLVSSINSLTIAEDVTSIERSAFSDCTAIESIVWNAKNYANPANTEAAPFLDIRSQIKSFTFGEAVEHIPAYLCYGMEKLTSVTTPNKLNTIGTSAFEGCARLAKISLGTGLEEIAANAFAGCTRLYDIYVYATYPPFAEESSFANYNVYVYIPCEYQRDYILDVVWGEFKFIECIDSEEATTDGNVTIVPGFNDVTITWPTETGADSYTIVIKKGDTVFCTLTFNADGQLLNIAFAPGRDGNHPAQYAEQAGNGYRFTVTGLEEATHYAYNIDVKNAANNTIKSHSGEFTTMGDTTTAVEDVLQNSTNCQKLLRDNQLLILRDGVEYTIMGAEIK